MKNNFGFLNMRYRIIRDRKFVFTISSYMAILLIFVNISLVGSPIVGVAASAIYFLINATYLGHALSEQENALIEFLLGLLVLVVILGLVGWAILVLYSLNNLASIIVLSIASSFASFLNRRVKTKNAVQ